MPVLLDALVVPHRLFRGRDNYVPNTQSAQVHRDCFWPADEFQQNVAGRAVTHGHHVIQQFRDCQRPPIRVIVSDGAIMDRPRQIGFRDASGPVQV